MKKLILKYKFSALILAILVTAAAFNGCGETVTPGQGDNLTFTSMSSNDSIGDSQGILVLDTVKILIKDIKVNYANNDDSSDYKIGPFVLFLDFSPTARTISTGYVPAGNYKKIKFEVHKLNDNEVLPDPEFADANGRYSVIVKGYYLGNYFVYKSTKSAHQILQFPSEIPIVSSYLTNITLVCRPYIWFVKNGLYLDPRDPANSNDIDNNIKDNIKNNFKAFRDNNKDGIID